MIGLQSIARRCERAGQEGLAWVLGYERHYQLQDRTYANSRFENLGVFTSMDAINATAGRGEGLEPLLEIGRAVQSTTDRSGTSER